MAKMKIYVDLEFAKQFGLAEKDFDGKEKADQIKLLDDAFKKKKESFDLIGQDEYFDNAKNIFPKIKDTLSKPTLVYVKTKFGDKIKDALVQVVGYSTVKNKVLVINPESKGDTLKVTQLELSDIFTSADDLQAFRAKKK